MIDKYGSNESPDFWYEKQTAKDLVSLFTEHRSLIQKELDDVLATGGRKLTEHDFLGPNERQKMKKTRQINILSSILKEKGQEAHKRALADIASEEKRDHTDFFNDLDNKLLEHRMNDHKKKVFEEANNREQADEESKQTYSRILIQLRNHCEKKDEEYIVAVVMNPTLRHFDIIV